MDVDQGVFVLANGNILYTTNTGKIIRSKFNLLLRFEHRRRGSRFHRVNNNVNTVYVCRFLFPDYHRSVSVRFSHSSAIYYFIFSPNDSLPPVLLVDNINTIKNNDDRFGVWFIGEIEIFIPSYSVNYNIL